MRERGAAVATESLTGRILDATLWTAVAERGTTVTAKPFTVWVLGPALNATHRFTRKNKPPALRISSSAAQGPRDSCETENASSNIQPDWECILNS